MPSFYEAWCKWTVADLVFVIFYVRHNQHKCLCLALVERLRTSGSMTCCVVCCLQAFPVMMGEVEPNGNLNANIIHQFTKSLRCKFISQVSHTVVCCCAVELYCMHCLPCWKPIAALSEISLITHVDSIVRQCWWLCCLVWVMWDVEQTHFVFMQYGIRGP